MQVPESAIKYRREHQSGKLCLWLVDGKHETFGVGSYRDGRMAFMSNLGAYFYCQTHLTTE